mgnify:CR=1 FL=1
MTRKSVHAFRGKVGLSGIFRADMLGVVALASCLEAPLEAPVRLPEVIFAFVAIPQQGRVGPVEWPSQCDVAVWIPVGTLVDFFVGCFLPSHDFLLRFLGRNVEDFTFLLLHPRYLFISTLV